MLIKEKIFNRVKVIDLSYILGIALLIAAIIYFFSANWPGFDRVTKIILSICLIALFYGLSILLAWFYGRRKLLSELLLFTGCLSFGVGVGLLGQIYNSHADSYLLFLVWFVPAILFSVLTKYEPFYLLSYVLFHLSAWFFLFPTSSFIYYSEERLVLIFLLLILLNGGLFVLIKRGLLTSTSIAFLCFNLFHLLFITLTITNLFETYGFMFNLLYIPLLIGQFYYFIKQDERKYVKALSFATLLYVLITYIELMFRYYFEAFFLLILVLVVLMIAGNTFLVKWLRKKREEEQKKRFFAWEKLLVGFNTSIGSFLAAVAVVSLVTLMLSDFPAIFYLFAAYLLVGSMLLAKKLEPSIRYPLLCMGYLFSFMTLEEVHVLWSLCFIVLLGVSWVHIPNKEIRSFAFFVANLQLMLILFLLDISTEVVFLSLFSLNLVFYWGCRYLEEPLKQTNLRQNSLIYAYLFFFSLTFVESQLASMYYVYNLLFFVLATFSLYWAYVKSKRYELRIAFLFWFLFLAYKYYDLLWRLLHKSIALSILGILFLSFAVWQEKKSTITLNRDLSIVRRKLGLIGLVILLQFGLLGFQIAKSEHTLANGETIKLELAPVDPRSLIQGDYVILGYAISRLEIEADLYPREKVQLVLAPNEQGVYQYAGFYKYRGAFNKDYVPSAADVLINARYDGRRGFSYGIESFFVPEGTGRQVEREAKYAYVKVGSNGDAILQRLAAE